MRGAGAYINGGRFQIDGAATTAGRTNGTDQFHQSLGAHNVAFQSSFISQQNNRLHNHQLSSASAATPGTNNAGGVSPYLRNFSSTSNNDGGSIVGIQPHYMQINNSMRTAAPQSSNQPSQLRPSILNRDGPLMMGARQILSNNSGMPFGISPILESNSNDPSNTAEIRPILQSELIIPAQDTQLNHSEDIIQPQLSNIQNENHILQEASHHSSNTSLQREEYNTNHQQEQTASNLDKNLESESQMQEEYQTQQDNTSAAARDQSEEDNYDQYDGAQMMNADHIMDTFELIRQRQNYGDEFQLSAMMMSNNLRAYEPIHGSMYDDEAYQHDEDEDDDDDDSGGGGIEEEEDEGSQRNDYYYDEEGSSGRDTYQQYEQEEHDDEENDENRALQALARVRANVVEERAGDEDGNEYEEQEDDDMFRAAAQVADDYYEEGDEEITSGEEIEEDDQQEDSQQDDDYQDEESELERYLRDVAATNNRARTAPLRPQNGIAGNGVGEQSFKMSPGFSQLEQAAVCAVQLVQRGDRKFDLDSYEGQNSCKKFLGHLEKLCESVEVKCQNRSYRKKFSNAYKVLYKEGKLCYLTEILDSAQEAFPYLWVNGEKYMFSKEVIEAGRNLFSNFCKILYHIKDAYQRICEEQSYEMYVSTMDGELRPFLEEFDLHWVTYEQLYVIELMLIEQDARRFITEAIELEKDITSAEVRERAKGKIMVDCPEYNKNRGKLIEIINKINAVANPEGKGRDDLQPEILFTAEGLCRRISSSQSKAVRKLAEAIRKSFQNFRTLLRKYEENIEGVDPQLKNNQDLVTALVDFEQSWEKGKSYFVNALKCNQLLHFTQIIEGTAEKYKSFSEQIEDRDTVIFVTIPALLILKNLDEDDKGICKMFFPPMLEEDPEDRNHSFKKYKELQSDYAKFRSQANNQYDYYNIVEQSVLEMESDEGTKSITEESLRENGMNSEDLHKLVQQIRLLSMQLQRHKPADWNEFLDVALDN